MRQPPFAAFSPHLPQATQPEQRRYTRDATKAPMHSFNSTRHARNLTMSDRLYAVSRSHGVRSVARPRLVRSAASPVATGTGPTVAMAVVDRRCRPPVRPQPRGRQSLPATAKPTQGCVPADCSRGHALVLLYHLAWQPAEDQLVAAGRGVPTAGQQARMRRWTRRLLRGEFAYRPARGRRVRGAQAVDPGPGAADGGFYDAVIEQRLRYIRRPALDAAVAGAAKRPLGDSWPWARRGAVGRHLPARRRVAGPLGPCHRAHLHNRELSIHLSARTGRSPMRSISRTLGAFRRYRLQAEIPSGPGHNPGGVFARPRDRGRDRTGLWRQFGPRADGQPGRCTVSARNDHRRAEERQRRCQRYVPTGKRPRPW